MRMLRLLLFLIRVGTGGCRVEVRLATVEMRLVCYSHRYDIESYSWRCSHSPILCSYYDQEVVVQVARIKREMSCNLSICMHLTKIRQE